MAYDPRTIGGAPIAYGGGDLSIPSTANPGGVDPRLIEIAREAAARFPLNVKVTPSGGKNARKSGTPNHPGGYALDFQIYDDKGKPLGNYRDPKSFRTYELFAQTMRQVQAEKYPELNDSFRFGGYFGGSHAFDQMHVDITPGAGAPKMGGWDTGLSDMARRTFPANSVGIGSYSLAALGGPRAPATITAGAGVEPPTSYGGGTYSSALNAVNSYSPVSAGAMMSYADPGMTTGRAGASYSGPSTYAPSTHRPSLPMTGGADRVTGSSVPTASYKAESAPRSIFPGSSIMATPTSYEFPIDYGVSAGANIPVRKVSAGVATPVVARKVVTPPVVEDPTAVVSRAPRRGLFAGVMNPRGPGRGDDATSGGFHPFGGFFANLFHPSGGYSPSGSSPSSGGGYTGLFGGSNPFIHGNATERQMSTAEYQAANPGPWSSSSSSKSKSKGR